MAATESIQLRIGLREFIDETKKQFLQLDRNKGIDNDDELMDKKNN